MPKIHLSKSEAQDILKNIEARGGDATHLKKVIDSDMPKDEATPDSAAEDEAWVAEKWKEAVPDTGDALICCLCHKPAKETRSNACYDCFKIWALECKPKKKKRRKRGDQHSSNNWNMQPIPG